MIMELKIKDIEYKEEELVELSLEVDGDAPTIFANVKGKKIELLYFNKVHDGRIDIISQSDEDKEILESVGFKLDDENRIMTD